MWTDKKFCILKVTEERSRTRSWIRIRQSAVRIRTCTKMSGIPNTGCTGTGTVPVCMRCIDSPTCRTLVTAPWSSSLSPWQKGEFWYSRAFAVFPQGELYIRISRSSLQRRPDMDIGWLFFGLISVLDPDPHWFGSSGMRIRIDNTVLSILNDLPGSFFPSRTRPGSKIFKIL